MSVHSSAFLTTTILSAATAGMAISNSGSGHHAVAGFHGVAATFCGLMAFRSAALEVATCRA